jgi:hypothetical protein
LPVFKSAKYVSDEQTSLEKAASAALKTFLEKSGKGKELI